MRPSRPMMRPFISSLGMSHRAGGRLGRVGGGVALHRGEQHFAGPPAGRSPRPACGTSMIKDCRAGLLLQVLFRAFPAAGAWSPLSRDRPLSSCSVCRCMSCSFDNSSLRRLTSWMRSVSLRWVLSTIFSCFRSTSACSSRASCRLSNRRSRSCSSPRRWRSSLSLSACCRRADSLISNSASRRRFSMSISALRTISRDSDSASLRRSRSRSRTIRKVNPDASKATTMTTTTLSTAWIPRINRRGPRATDEQPTRTRRNRAGQWIYQRRLNSDTAQSPFGGSGRFRPPTADQSPERTEHGIANFAKRGGKRRIVGSRPI